MGWDFLDHQTCKGLAKDRSILVDIVDIRTEKIGPPRRDSCCCEMRTFYNEVYSIETLLRITCQIISELKHPPYCFPKFVSIWPAPEVVDGIFEVCPSATKFCPLVNNPVALGFSLSWQIFDINKQFCPQVRLGPYVNWTFGERQRNIFRYCARAMKQMSSFGL